jgi:hypothetical protein
LRKPNKELFSVGTIKNFKEINMIWEWDNFQEIISKFPITFETNEILPDKINKVRFERVTNFRIHMIIDSPPTSLPRAKKRVPNEVYRNDNKVTFTSPLGSGLIRNIAHKSSHTSYGDSGNDKSINVYAIDSIEFSLAHSKKSAYVVEDLANVPTNYLWPSAASDKSTTSNTRTFPGNPPIIFKTEQGRLNTHRTAMQIDVDGTKLIIGEIVELDNNVKDPGYITYIEYKDEPLRNQIRDCMSYAFGLPLVYFGYSEYDEKGKLTAFKALSPATVNGRAWDIPSLPPAPITQQNGTTNLLDIDLFQNITTRLLKSIYLYNISVLLWRLWYAESAPYFMRPAYFGALIEGFQKVYIKSNDAVSRTIVEKSEYSKVKKTLLRYLNRLKVGEAEKSLFLNNIHSGNCTSHRVVSERFYLNLGLEIGSLENNAWSKRNDAAHGNVIHEDDQINFIRETKILRAMLHRIILKVTDGSPYYFDYYTYGRPIRLISESIQE